MRKFTIAILLLCCIGFFQYCSSSKKAKKSVTTVSYEKDIMPIIQANCTPCHFPPDGKKEPLNTYDAVKTHYDDMIARVKLPHDNEKFMPFKNKKPALSDTAINLLEEWKKQDMPQ
jgi:nitrate/TMAO reductase-like tetraheme cytochrome c subunit